MYPLSALYEVNDVPFVSCLVYAYHTWSWDIFSTFTTSEHSLCFFFSNTTNCNIFDSFFDYKCCKL